MSGAALELAVQVPRMRITSLWTLVALASIACSGVADSTPGAEAKAKPETAKASGTSAKTPTPETTPPPDTSALDLAAADKKAIARMKIGAVDKTELATRRTQMVGALNEGRKLVKAGDFAGGIAKYEALLAIDPHYGPALGELGWAEFKAERYEAAQAHTLQALAQAPDDKRRGMFYYNLGRIAEARDQTEAAIEAYALSLSFRPNDVVADRLAMISHVVDAAGTAFEHPAVEAYRAKFGADAKPAPTALAILGSGLPTTEAACKVASLECGVGDDALCTFEKGTDDTWGTIHVDDSGMMGCWHPVVKVDEGWSLFAVALAEQWGSEISQGVDAVSTRVITNDAGTFLIIDYSDHAYERDWGWGELEEDEEIPEGDASDSEGMIICKRGTPNFCTAPIPRLAERSTAGDDWKYEAKVDLEGDVVVVSKVVSSGAVEFGPRDSVWDVSLPLPEGRYPLADLR